MSSPRTFARFLAALAAFLLVCTFLLYGTGGHAASFAGTQGNAASTACKTIGVPKDLAKAAPTSLATIEQGYNCLLAHYLTGKSLDDRVLLRGAYNGLVRQLRQAGVNLPDAVLPPLSGNRAADWQVFSTAYTSLVDSLPRFAFAASAIAQATLQEMANSLHDDHTTYLPPEEMRPAVTQLDDSGPIPSFGVITSPLTPTVPIYITDVFPGSPAASAGLLPGDTITAIGGQPPFSGGFANAGLISFALPQIGTPVTLTIVRPATGATLNVSLSPRPLTPPDTTARLVARNIAYVRLYEFTRHAADRVFAAIKALGPGVRGVVLDLRGNEGGYADQPVRLVSAFVHHQVVSIAVDGNGKRELQRTVDTVPLLHLPLAVLIDQGSASSSEITAAAVHDYGLGSLVGEQSAGALAAAEYFGLSDGSGLEITEQYILGPRGERIDGIGVAPNQRVPVSATDLSTGHDPAIDQAVRDLRAAGATAP